MGYFSEFHKGDYEIHALAKKGKYKAGDVLVKCSLCSNDKWEKHRLTQMGPLSYCLICDNCGHVMWFGHAPKKVQE